MKPRLITISEDASVYEAAKKMKDEQVGSLLVQDHAGQTCGIVTDEDIIRKAVAQRRMDCTVSELESKPLITIQTDADIAAAAKLMGKKNIKRLAVLSDEKRVIGVISERDIVRISPSLYDLMHRGGQLEKTQLS